MCPVPLSVSGISQVTTAKEVQNLHSSKFTATPVQHNSLDLRLNIRTEKSREQSKPHKKFYQIKIIATLSALGQPP